MSKTLHPGAFVQLTTGPYKAVLWGDEVNIPAFMVERIEGETIELEFGGGPGVGFSVHAGDSACDWLDMARFVSEARLILYRFG